MLLFLMTVLKAGDPFSATTVALCTWALTIYKDAKMHWSGVSNQETKEGQESDLFSTLLPLFFFFVVVVNDFVTSTV